MAYELIITEKPAAMKKIADALADGKAIKQSINGIASYKVTHGKKDIVVTCAVGHLYTVTEKEKKGWTYPVFETKWEQSSKVNKASAFTSKYVTAIKKLAKGADEFTIATDFDIEGEVIGFNVLKHACKQKDAKRMKFSTLTEPELRESYKNINKTIEWGQANAGLTRHVLDWYYGINLSRALSLSLKKAGMFKVLSSGRVQGPTLKIIVDREKEIQAFKPDPFWEIDLDGTINKENIIASHKEGKIFDKKRADEIINNTKGKDGVVDKVNKKKFNQAPPVPFDLTTLQTESFRVHRIQPKYTLDIAQSLYLAGLISYPRTSSQQLPTSIGYKKLLTAVSKNSEYKELANKILKKKTLKPNNGKKTDPAHPAIYPTGIKKALKDKEKKVYDLIVKRFLATFSDPATRETVSINIDVNKEIFVAKGTRTLVKGWHEFYAPYVKLEEEEMPNVNNGDNVKVKKITQEEKETKPPKRYNIASIIKELEKRELGTKCLTSDTLVKVHSNNKIYNVKIAKLFDSLCGDSQIEEKSMGIAINNKKSCFCFNDFEEIQSYFELVSKRKLKKSEKVYRIKYMDGSSIKLTEDHPILVFSRGKCKYVRTKDLKNGMKSITSIKFPEKQGDTICTWEEFLKKSSTKTKLYGISNEINRIRSRCGLSQHKFGKKYGILQSVICQYEKSQNIPLYITKRLNLAKPRMICSVNKNTTIKNPFPLKMSSALARILANLVGDCSIDTSKIKKENCYDFRYHNTNIDLINRFIKDIKYVFGVDLVVKLAKPRPGHLPKYYVRIPAVAGRIFALLFPEVIKKNAVKISTEFYPNYIGTLFDDEGHCAKSEPKLFISNTNFRLLENVKKMLSTLGIVAKLDKKQYKLYIRGRENIQKFLEKIPFYSLQKKKRLVNILSKFYRFGRRQSSPQKQYRIVSLLTSTKNNELTNREISEKICFKMSKTKEHLNQLIKLGYIIRLTKGTSQGPRKIITYKLIKSIEETFFRYINEEVISADFITKTINSIEVVDYKGHVYDITNSPEIPNFILSNGVVVHNSTRATIVDTLFNRGYVCGQPIEATALGLKTIETLEKYIPQIVDEALTKYFEEEMDGIRNGKKKGEDVLKEAKKVLTKLLTLFKKHDESIGKELMESNREAETIANTVGKCPVCEGTLMMRKGKFGKFIACDKYPDCKTTFKLPQYGTIKPIEKVCEVCGYPMVKIIKKRGVQEICINQDCKSKKLSTKLEKELKKIEDGKVEKICPKCGKPLVVRRSVYGSFFGCSGFPKCRHIEKVQDEEKAKKLKEKVLKEKKK